jgi:hypothetical protein
MASTRAADQGVRVTRPGEPVSETGGMTIDMAESICCTGCGLHWFGGYGYRTDDPDPGEPLEPAFYCPNCSVRDLGHSRRV